MTSTNISQGFPIAILNDCLLPAMSLAWCAVPPLLSEPFDEPLPLPVPPPTWTGPVAATVGPDLGPSDVRSLSEALLWPAAASFSWSEPFDEPPGAEAEKNCGDFREDAVRS